MKTNLVSLDQRNRERFFALVGQHLPELYDWVRREIAILEESGDLVRGELAPEEVVDAVVLQAYRDFVKNSTEPDVNSRWLDLAKKHLGIEVGRLKSWRNRTVHTEEDVPETPPKEEVSTLGDEILDFYEPDEDLKLEDILPDLVIPEPDQEMEAEDLRSCINTALDGMPKEWRRIFLLNQTTGDDGVRLSKAIGRTEHEVRGILEHARRYLRQRLVEMGCMFKSEGTQTS